MEATRRGQLPSLPEDQLRPSQVLKAPQMLQTPSASSNNGQEGSQDPPPAQAAYQDSYGASNSGPDDRTSVKEGPGPSPLEGRERA